MKLQEQEFYDRILPILDQKIGTFEFICGDDAEMSVVDI
jgi:hypothetical protein